LSASAELLVYVKMLTDRQVNEQQPVEISYYSSSKLWVR